MSRMEGARRGGGDRRPAKSADPVAGMPGAVGCQDAFQWDLASHRNGHEVP